MRYRQVVDRQKGAFQRAPFVLSAIVVFFLISLIAMIRGWWIYQQSPSSTLAEEIPPVTSEHSKMHLSFKIDLVSDISGNQTTQKQAGMVAGQVFSLMNQPMKNSNERFNKLKEFVAEPLFSTLRSQLDLPLEPVMWKKIKVVPVQELAPDYWCFLVGGVIQEEEVESVVQIQVRKVAGVWKVVSIEEGSR